MDFKKFLSDFLIEKRWDELDSINGCKSLGRLISNLHKYFQTNTGFILLIILMFRSSFNFKVWRWQLIYIDEAEAALDSVAILTQYPRWLIFFSYRENNKKISLEIYPSSSACCVQLGQCGTINSTSSPEILLNIKHKWWGNCRQRLKKWSN